MKKKKYQISKLDLIIWSRQQSTDLWNKFTNLKEQKQLSIEDCYFCSFFYKTLRKEITLQKFIVFSPVSIDEWDIDKIDDKIFIIDDTIFDMEIELASINLKILNKQKLSKTEIEPKKSIWEIFHSIKK